MVEETGCFSQQSADSGGQGCWLSISEGLSQEGGRIRRWKQPQSEITSGGPVLEETKWPREDTVLVTDLVPAPMKP